MLNKFAYVWLIYFSKIRLDFVSCCSWKERDEEYERKEETKPFVVWTCEDWGPSKPHTFSIYGWCLFFFHVSWMNDMCKVKKLIDSESTNFDIIVYFLTWLEWLRVGWLSKSQMVKLDFVYLPSNQELNLSMITNFLSPRLPTDVMRLGWAPCIG